MNRYIFLLLFFLGFSVPLSALEEIPPAQGEIVKSIVKHFYDQQNLNGASGRLLQDIMFKLRMVESSSKGARETEVFLLAKDSKTRLVYLKDDRGTPTVVLQRGTGTWIYREALRLPLKISLSQSIFGEVNLADILGINLIDDFTCTSYKANGDGNEMVLQFTRTNSLYPYSAVEVVDDQVSLDFKKIGYQSLGKVTIREAVLVDYQELTGGHRVPK